MTDIVDILPQGIQLKGRYNAYIIDGKIGEGGFGILYKGHTDSGTPQPVAIKQFCPYSNIDENTLIAMLSNEEAMLKRISDAHPKFVPPYHETFQYEGRIFMVMDYIEGANLSTCIMQQPDQKITVANAFALIYPLADVLFDMHKWSYFHGDITPDNIMVEFDEHNMPKLRFVDFGFAMVIDPARQLPSRVLYAHTKGYTDPQLQTPPDLSGMITSVDQRTLLKKHLLARDFYGLVATVYFMVTGKDPDPDNIDVTGLDDRTSQFFKSHLGKGHQDIWQQIGKSKTPAEVEANIFIEGLRPLGEDSKFPGNDENQETDPGDTKTRNSLWFYLVVGVILLGCLVRAIDKYASYELDKATEIEMPTSAVSDADHWTQQFDDYYNGLISQEEMKQSFTENAYYMVKNGDFLNGHDNDPLFSVKQLLDTRYQPDYQIGTNYKITNIEREETTGLIRRLILEKQSETN